MNPDKVTLLKSFGFAVEGIKIATRYNRNIRIHFLLAVVALIAGVFFGLNLSEFAIIAMIVVLVISSEMINTAIEEVIDLVTKEYREEARFAKDVSAGMVLLVALGSILVGLLIFIPHVLRYFGI